MTKLHSCMNLASWEKHKAELLKPNQYCVVDHSDFQADSFSFHASCKGDGLSVTLEANESWAGGHELHMKERMITVYPDKAGMLTHDREVESRLQSTDCGSIVPGSPVELK